MPEGPSIVILKEETKQFKGHAIVAAAGNVKTIDVSDLVGEKITDIKTWGKHFLICLPKFTIRIHLLMFGRYSINERRNANPKLSLSFSNGDELNFYACSIQRIDKPLKQVYDFTADVMNRNFDSRKANKKLGSRPSMLVCDAILDQNIFAGAGNIFKNEVLYRIKVHPLSKIGALPATKRRELVKGVVAYGKDFLKWKKAFVLKKHWEAHTKKKCKRDGNTFRKEYLGKAKRRSFYCIVCQKLYQ